MMAEAPEFIEFEDEGAPSVAGDVAKAAPRGLAKGVTDLAGMPGDMLSMKSLVSPVRRAERRATVPIRSSRLPRSFDLRSKN